VKSLAIFANIKIRGEGANSATSKLALRVGMAKSAALVVYFLPVAIILVADIGSSHRVAGCGMARVCRRSCRR
jgi:hypothetical protein